MNIKKLDLLLHCDVELFRRFYTEVFKEAFPNDDECESFEGFMAQAERMHSSSGNYRFIVYVATDDYNKPICGLIADYYVRSNTTLIEYQVTSSSYRGQGIGEKLFYKFLEELEEMVFWEFSKLPEYIFWETENPVKYKEDVTEQAKRRWKYFSKLGARKVDYDYIQPPLEDNKSVVDFLDLCVLRLGPGANAKFIQGFKVQEFLYDYFTHSIACDHVTKLAVLEDNAKSMPCSIGLIDMSM